MLSLLCPCLPGSSKESPMCFKSLPNNLIGLDKQLGFNLEAGGFTFQRKEVDGGGLDMDNVAPFPVSGQDFCLIQCRNQVILVHSARLKIVLFVELCSITL